ncbi:hypothetical protein [Lacibacter sp. H407]|uniref:hypothetical protein n=1 Tax=Lacibacter sp. H407 TaxID=3133423 RepID=UPI0030BFAB5E
MSTKKAKLTVILKADNTIVAEVEDPILWQKVLSLIHGNLLENPIGKNKFQEDGVVAENINEVKPKNDSTLSRFSHLIGVSESVLKGALDPSSDPPYLHLDRHCWEAMKKNTPQRGKGAISPTALSATLLCLWFNEIGLGNPIQSQALGVLKVIGVLDKNASRGIKLTPWLQSRPGGVVVINPSQISKAYTIANSFCTKNWSNKEENKK